jgi:hypothetical protein
MFASSAAPVDLEATGTLGPFTRVDRVPAELALAYAARAGSPITPPQLASAGSMAVAAPSRAAPALVTSRGTTSVAVKPAETTGQGQQARTIERLNNPWLRGLVLAPSVQNAMTVTVFGDPDFRGLVQYMRKPASAVMMTFSHDPHLGMTPETFTGSAVVFQATVTFEERRHVALR